MADLFEQMGGGLLAHDEDRDRYDNSRWATRKDDADNSRDDEEEDTGVTVAREYRSFTEAANVARKLPKASIPQNREWHAAIVRGRAPDATHRERRAGGRAEREMAEGNLGLVWHFAKRFTDMGVPTDELMAAGRAGLARALATFDPDKGALSTHARFWIEEECRLALDNAHPLHVTDHGHKALDKVREARRTLLVVGRREPTPGEIAAYTGVPVSTVIDLLLATEGVTSTDAPMDDGGALHDLFHPGNVERDRARPKHRPKKGETWQEPTGPDEEVYALPHRMTDNGEAPLPRRKQTDLERQRAMSVRPWHLPTPAHRAHLERKARV